MPFSVIDNTGRLKTVGATGSTGATGATGVTGPAGPIGLGLDGNDGLEGLLALPGDLIESGSWTPVIGGSGGTSGQTYVAQVGFFARYQLTNGMRIVAIGFRAELSAKGTITNNVQIQTLPFPSSALNLIGAIPIIWTTLSVAKVYVGGLIVSNSSVISVRGNNAASVSLGTPLLTADIANTTVLSGTGIYFTD